MAESPDSTFQQAFFREVLEIELNSVREQNFALEVRLQGFFLNYDHCGQMKCRRFVASDAELSKQVKIAHLILSQAVTVLKIKTQTTQREQNNVEEVVSFCLPNAVNGPF